MIKKLFEKTLLSSRWFVFLPVIFGTISAMILFIASTFDMIHMMLKTFYAFITGTFNEHMHADVVSQIIGSVDLYLIAIVLLIFSFGVYELFISPIRFNDERYRLPKILSIQSLDELKDKLAKVIVMVLVVNYFQRVLYIKYEGSLEMMYFALSISALSVAVYLLHKDAKFKKTKDDNG